MENKIKHKIFISYGKKDAMDFAQKLDKWLKDNGYEPWFDKNDIPAGVPFDVAIEFGIEDSKVFISLLSSWSLKPESFCRNEIVFAQNCKVPIIPIRIADITTPPVLIASLNYIDAANDPEIAFTALPEMLQYAITYNRSSYRRLTEDENKWWLDHKKMNFEEELSKYGVPFIGREWLFEDINEWINDNDSRLLLIIADAGIGKSTIATQLTTKFNIRGIHYCSSSIDKSCEAISWLYELIYQLSAQFDLYREKIEQFVEPDWSKTVESLFRTYVIAPLNSFKNEIDVSQPWIFIIDSLDESLSIAGLKLVELLSWSVSRLPDWLRIIATTRPDQTIISALEFEFVKKLVIHSDNENNQADLKKYWKIKLNNIVMKASEIQISKMIDKILKLAEGNFLYSKVLLDYLVDINKEGKDIFSVSLEFPKTLTGLYRVMFRKRFNDITKYKADVLPLLNCLIAAKDKIPDDLLIGASKLDEETAKNGISLLSQFLIDSENCYSLFHQSIAMWLKEYKRSNEFSCSEKIGQKLLADECWKEFLNNPIKKSSYCYDNLHIHLMECKLWDKLLELIKHPEMNLINRWVEGGETQIGILCLEGIIKEFYKDKKERIYILGLTSQLARIYSVTGKYEKAEHWLSKILKQTSLFRGRRIKAITLHELGSIHLYLGNYDQSICLYRKALNYCNQFWRVYHDEAAANLIGMATVEIEKYDYKTGKDLASKAIIRSHMAYDIRHVIAGELLIGSALKSLGNYMDSEIFIDNALKKCDEYTQERYKCRLLMLKGWLEFDRSTLKNETPIKAKFHFDEALILSNRVQDFFVQIEANLSLGWVSLLDSKLDESEYYFSNSLERANENYHKELVTGIKVGLAALEHRKSNYDKALDLYKEILDYCNKNDIRKWQYKTLAGVGSLFFWQNDQLEASKYWSKALRVAQSISQGKEKLCKAIINACKNDILSIPR